MSFRSVFQDCFILYQFFPNTLIILVLFLQIFWITEFIDHIPEMSGLFFFLFLHFSNHFFFDAQNVLLVTVAMLLFYQTNVNCRSSKVEGNFTHNMNFHFSGLAFI